jgi:MinD-like ATPase involved in chromosome partitioning or flagellar assembly
MKTFDEIGPEIRKILQSRTGDIAVIDKLIINRDLNGRIRLLADEKVSKKTKKILENIAESIAGVLEKRVPDQDRVIYEPSLGDIIKTVPSFTLEGFPNVTIADRLLGETNWGDIASTESGTRRFVFYSIKGGVGRSTALAVTAWALAEEGKRVLVLDMDLESPGISSSLLSSEKAPMYGIVDWLVEDLIDNGDTITQDIFSVSDLSRNGEIFIVPSYGKKPGEYISKIGRVWMPKINDNNRELWQNRMNRLIKTLTKQHKPDVILIDSRAGIDEISSACITSFGAESILLFSIDSDQTWNGYRILFDHWHMTGAVDKIRDRLQIVGALIPDHIQSNDYIDGLCEHSWDLFTEKIYDSIPAINPRDDHTDSDYFNFDKNDREAPHFPRIVRWNRGFESISNLYKPLRQQVIQGQLGNVFGDLIDYVKDVTGNG